MGEAPDPQKRNLTPAETSPRGKRLAGFTLLFIVLTALGLYAVYTQTSGHALEWDPRLLSPRLILPCLGLLLLYWAADGLRLWFTLKALGHTVPLTAMLRLVFLNLYVSNITPLATGGGVIQVWFLRRRGVPVGTGITATTIRTVLAVLFIFGLSPLMFQLLPGAEAAARGSSVFIPLVITISLYLGFFLAVILFPQVILCPLLGLLTLLRRLHLISRNRHGRWRRRVGTGVRRFSRGFALYLPGKWYHLAGSIFFTALFLLSLFSFPALLFTALGYDFAYWLVLGRMILTTLVMYFSPTPGASGIAEGVFGQFFSDVVTPGHLVLVTLAWRAVTIYSGMLLGLLTAQGELGKNRTAPEKTP